MNRLKKTDYIIIAVLLALVVLIVMMVTRSNAATKRGVSAPAQTSAAGTPRTLTYSDYNGKTIGIRNSSNFEPITLEKFPDSKYLYFENDSDLIQALQSNKIDAFLDDEPVAAMIHIEQPDVNYLKEPIVKDDYYFGFPKDTERSNKLRTEFNELLAELKSSGELDKMKEKWLGKDENTKTYDDSGLTGKNGEITVAVVPENVPFAYTANNELQGYVVELVTMLARRGGYSIRFEQANISSCLAGLTSGKYDIFAGSLSYTEERAQSIDYSDVIYNGGVMLVARTEDIGSGETASSDAANVSDLTGQVTAQSVQSVKTVKDYAGKKIGVQTGTVFDEMIKENIPDAEISYYNSYTDLLQALKAGIIDGFAADEPMVKYMMTEDSAVDYLKDKMDDYSFGFAFSKDDKGEALCNEFSKYITKIKSDGTLDEIDGIWFGTDESKKVIPDVGTLSGEKGKLSLAVESANAPFVYIKDNEIVGYEIDIAYRFCKDCGYGLELVDMNFDAIIPAVSSGKNDFGASTITITEERRESVNFSEPHYDGGSVLAVSASDLTGQVTAQSVQSVKTVKDYAGKKIGVQTGTVFDEMIKENIPDAEISYYNSYTDLLQALKAGIIDGFAADEPMVKYMMTEDSAVDYLKDKMDDYSFGFAFSKDDKGEALCNEFSEYITKIKSDGTLDEIDGIWFGTDESKKVIPDVGTLSGEKGKLSLAVESANAPFVYIKDNEIVGYEIDIAYRFCKDCGYGLELVDMNFDAIIPAVSSGKNDFGASTITITEERRESVNFSEPHYDGGSVLAVSASDLENMANTAVKSDAVEDRSIGYYAANGKIGVITGSLYETMVCERYPEVDILQFNSQPDLAIALSEGKIDAFIVPKTTAEDFIAANSSLTYLNEIFMEIPYGFAFKKTDGENKLRDQMNEYLAKIHADGTYDEIVDTWFGSDESKKTVDFTGLDSAETTLRYVTSSTMQPYTYIKDGQNAGLEVDLIVHFCKEYGYGLRIDNADFAGLIPGIAGGTYDIASGNIMITEERAQSVDFSDVYYTGAAVMVVRKETVPAVQETLDEAPENSGFIAGIKESFNKNFIREDRYKLILEGISTTCVITALSVVFGSLLAFLICLFRRADSVLSGKICDLYVKLLQGTPMVVLLMILYYVIFGKSGIAAMWVAVIGFSLNFGAYVSEILRSGIDSIDGGQREAALALGFSENQSFFRFIFPQAAVRQLPVYRGEIISLLKNTSIVGYIAIQDLTKMSDIIRSRTYEAFFPLIVTAVIYFILAWIISLVLKFVLKQTDPRSKKRGVKGVALK